MSSTFGEMDESQWIKLFCGQRADFATLSAAMDWFQERDDPVWSLLAWFADRLERNIIQCFESENQPKLIGPRGHVGQQWWWYDNDLDYHPDNKIPSILSIYRLESSRSTMAIFYSDHAMEDAWAWIFSAWREAHKAGKTQAVLDQLAQERKAYATSQSRTTSNRTG